MITVSGVITGSLMNNVSSLLCDVKRAICALAYNFRVSQVSIVMTGDGRSSDYIRIDSHAGLYSDL